VPLANVKSPDRMDALVWGITELLIDTEEMPQSQSLVVPVQISRY
jgi:phage terminase large subunit-like protein